MGMSLRELGALVDLAPSFLSDVERGVRKPSLESLERISRALDIPLGDLFDSEGEKSVDLHRLLSDSSVTLNYRGEPLTDGERRKLLDVVDAAMNLRSASDSWDNQEITRFAAHMEGEYGRPPSVALRGLINEIVRQVREEYRRQDG